MALPYCMALINSTLTGPPLARWSRYASQSKLAVRATQNENLRTKKIGPLVVAEPEEIWQAVKHVKAHIGN